MAKNRDKTPHHSVLKLAAVPRPATRPVRVIQVQPTARKLYHDGTFQPEYFYHVRAGGPAGEILYVSESYASKTGARTAAVREHEGRSKFEYILEWPDGRTGKTNRETL